MKSRVALTEATVTLSRVIALALVFGLSATPGLVIAQQPQTLYVFCLDPQDHNQRAIQRAMCDQAAQDRLFAHGVIRPFQCPVCVPRPGEEEEECEECEVEGCEQVGTKSYMCQGVGQ